MPVGLKFSLSFLFLVFFWALELRAFLKCFDS